AAGQMLYDSLSDADVMLRAGCDDDAAFSYLANKYHRSMIAFMYRMCHNQAIAEELAQEVFLRVYRSRSSYQAEAKFSTWLYRIATNLAVNHARDTRSERTVPTLNLDEPDPETGTTPDVADATPTIEADILREERMAAIDRKSTRLNSSHSQISYAVFCLKKKIRKETVLSELDVEASRTVMGAVGMAVMRPPFASQFVEDLRRLFEAGTMLGARILHALVK